jgi:hypothetical protein
MVGEFSTICYFLAVHNTIRRHSLRGKFGMEWKAAVVPSYTTPLIRLKLLHSPQRRFPVICLFCADRQELFCLQHFLFGTDLYPESEPKPFRILHMQVFPAYLLRPERAILVSIETCYLEVQAMHVPIRDEAGHLHR